MYFKSLGFVAILGLSGVAHSQITTLNPAADVAHITFTGVVQNDPSKSIQIAHYVTDPATGGQTQIFAPYTGPVPAYPYKVGDTVQLTYNVIIPSPSAISGGAAASYLGSDGLYHFPISSANPQGTTGVVSIQSSTFSVGGGPAQTIPNFGNVSLATGLSITYNPNTGNYALPSTGASGWASPLPALPTYGYNSATGAIASTTASGAPITTFSTADCVGGISCIGGTIGGTDTSASIQYGNSGRIPIIDSITGLFTGFMNALGITGKFNTDSFGGSTGATDVPEPGAIGLFLSGVAGLWLVRRRRVNRTQA